MIVAALYSGGKDSTFALIRAIEAGHQIACLISFLPSSDESMLWHYPNAWITRLQAEAMEIPVIQLRSSEGQEAGPILDAFGKAKSEFGIEGLVHGGIASQYQKHAFEKACMENQLTLVSPLWHVEPLQYMNDLLRNALEIIVVSVSAMGLDQSWLGRKLDKDAVAELTRLSQKFGFNLTFEGGEAETLVTDCPIFKKRLAIIKSKKVWDGQRGMFEILEASLVSKDV